jgi:hypothetical protein
MAEREPAMASNSPAKREDLNELHKLMTETLKTALTQRKTIRANFLAVAVAFLRANNVRATDEEAREELTRLHKLVASKLVNALKNPPGGVLRASMVAEAIKFLAHSDMETSSPAEASERLTALADLALPFA